RRARRAFALARRGGARFVRAVRHRSRSLGLVGKTGVGIVGGAPLVGSALDAADVAFRGMRQYNAGLVGGAKVGFWTFINGISKGFGGGDIVNLVDVTTTDGKTIQLSTASGVPSGAWWK